MSTLQIQISETTADWLEREARARGADVPKVVATILDETVRASSSSIKEAAQRTPQERLEAFAELTRTLKPRSGPSADDSRESIYED